MKEFSTYSLPKNKLSEFIAGLEEFEVYAPHKDGEIFLFQKVTNPKKVDLTYSNTSKPPKSVVFPQAECFMDYKILEKGYKIDDKSSKQPKTIIFGIRGCDAQAFTYLDKVMLEGTFIDPYYQKRRNNTILIGLACNVPPYYNCFCTSLGGAPHSSENLDMQLVELKDTYLIKPLTDRGNELLTHSKNLLQKSKPAELQESEQLKKTSEKAIVRTLDVKGIPEQLDKIFESTYWNQVSDPCIGCGICTFLCPTCFCFDINDIGGKKGGQRVRVWDTCQFPEYTLHASSHNPRDNKMKRQRQRFYHKYNYSMKNQQMIGCVGCGRCVNQCPTQIDIINVIGGSREAEK